MKWMNANYTLRDDLGEINLKALGSLYQQTHWADDYSERYISEFVSNSFWLRVYDGDRLVGFIRAITDKVSTSWICDVVVDQCYRNCGVGTMMMHSFLDHSDISRTSIGLGTPNADSFFAKFGFERKGVVMLRSCQPSNAASAKP